MAALAERSSIQHPHGALQLYFHVAARGRHNTRINMALPCEIPHPDVMNTEQSLLTLSVVATLVIPELGR